MAGVLVRLQENEPQSQQCCSMQQRKMSARRTLPVFFALCFILIFVWLATNRSFPMKVKFAAIDEMITVINKAGSDKNANPQSGLVTEPGNASSEVVSEKTASDIREAHVLMNSVSDVQEEYMLFKEPVPGEENIIFLETKCAGLGLDDQPVLLNPRQACAMESATITNPNASVYMLHACEVKRSSILEGPNYLRQLFTYPKVHLSKLQFTRQVEGTPLEEWAKKKLLSNSRYPTEHTSDVLRYVMMWKYGGTYLDHDVVVMRSLSGLSNFAGAESTADVAAGVLNFDHEGVGHEMAAACLEDLRTQFRGEEWGHNGPGVITRVLKQVCGVKQIKDMTPERCRGFTVHPPSSFYPIPWRQWRHYFDEKDADKVMAKLNGSLAIHVWNKFSVAENITVGSRQPYAQIAEKFCPKVYSHCGNIF